MPGHGKPFAAGVSGNPGGRPKSLVHVRELARAHTEEAIATLVQLMRLSKNDSVRGAAANALLDRGWGKPTSSLAHFLAKSQVSADELREIANGALSSNHSSLLGDV